MGLMEWLKSKKTIGTSKVRIKQQEIKSEIKANSEGCCPKCGSTELSAKKKGYTIVKTMVLPEYIGRLGLIKRVVEITCLKCGNRFKTYK